MYKDTFFPFNKNIEPLKNKTNLSMACSFFPSEILQKLVTGFGLFLLR